MDNIINFNYYEYINNYNDIAHMNEEEAYNHYLIYGKKENRIFNTNFFKDFDYQFYINNYEDIKCLNLNKHNAILHYIRYGKYDNRYFINLSNFNYEIYKNNYNDIVNLSYDEAKMHYFKYGRFENRTYLFRKLNNNDTFLPSKKIDPYNYSLLNKRVFNIQNIKFIDSNNNLCKLFKKDNEYNNINLIQKKISKTDNINFIQKNIYPIISIPSKIYDESSFPKIITMISPECMLFISNIIQKIFNDNGWFCYIVNIDYNNYEQILKNPNHFIFIYCLFLIKDIEKLPRRKYIIYQLEQNVDKLSSHYISLYNNDNNNLITLFQNSRINLDYSHINIDFFKRNFNLNFFYLPTPILNNHIISSNENILYDLIFIGCKNKRRIKIIEKLKLKYNIYVPKYNIYYKELHKFFYKTKILLNIHYYDNAILESVRINEALYCGIKIISEKPCIQDNNMYNLYKDVVEFINIIEDDYTELFNKIDYLLINYNKDIIEHRNKIIKFINKESCNFIDIFNNILNINNLAILNKEIAVVTANIGIYDKEATNLQIINNYNYFDWYYFVDEKSRNLSNDWNVTYLDINNHKINFHNNINMMYAKYFKVQSNKIELLQKYKYIIWIDSSIIINNINFVLDILNIIQENYNTDFFIYEHYCRNNIYDELNISINLDKYNNLNIIGQVDNYYYNNYKDTNLYEAGFFIYKNNNLMHIILNEWWDEIIKYSYQDQISLPYILWKNNIIPNILNDEDFVKGELQGSIWNNKLIGYVRDHNI